VFGVKQGIILAIVLSLIDHVRRGYKPHATLVAGDDHGRITNAQVETAAELAPGLAVFRYAASLYYANANRFTELALEVMDTADPPVTWFCVDAAAMADVDFTAAETIRELHASLKDRGARLVFSAVMDDVRAELDRYGITELVGEDAFFASVGDVRDAFGAATPTA
jgi:MFS superfamily sulfate permease-like transporter